MGISNSKYLVLPVDGRIAARDAHGPAEREPPRTPFGATLGAPDATKLSSPYTLHAVKRAD